MHRLFETHPDVQEVFMPFKGKSKEDLSHSAQLKAHALRVMGTVEKCLARINEPKKMEELLHDLGAKHVMYNARVDYIDVSINVVESFLFWGLRFDGWVVCTEDRTSVRESFIKKQQLINLQCRKNSEKLVQSKMCPQEGGFFMHAFVHKLEVP